MLVTNITLSPSPVYVTTSSSAQLTATVSPSDAKNKTLTWSSSNPSVATVSSTGKVTGVSAGTCTITCAATDGSGVKATCAVTVSENVYALWCAGNQTLYFTRRNELLAAGDTFTPEDGSGDQTVTALWSGMDVKASGGSMPAWWMTVYALVKNVVVEPDFRQVPLTSTAYWFFLCSQLTSITGLEYLNTSEVTSMAGMFGNCMGLPRIDLPLLNTARVTTMQGMFQNCMMLTRVDLSGFNTSMVTDMQGMFMGCTALKTIYVGDLWKTDAVTNGTTMFQNCMNLVGGHGTVYDASHIDHAYAHIDAAANPGYLTDIEDITFVLTDGEVYSRGTDTECERIRYVRTFTTTGWQALYVPVALNYDGWAADFEVARLNDVHQWDDNDDGEIDRTELEIVKLKSGTTEPNTPYLIRARSVGEKTLIVRNTTLHSAEEQSTDCSSFQTLFTVTGTYSGLSGADMLSHGYYAMGSGSLHQAASASSNLSPMRWYVSVTDRDGNPKGLGEVKVMVFGEDGGEATSISSVSRDAFAAPEDAPVFDLSGRRIAKPRKGIYVKGGRKYIVK